MSELGRGPAVQRLVKGLSGSSAGLFSGDTRVSAPHFTKEMVDLLLSVLHAARFARSVARSIVLARCCHGECSRAIADDCKTARTIATNRRNQPQIVGLGLVVGTRQRGEEESCQRGVVRLFRSQRVATVGHTQAHRARYGVGTTSERKECSCSIR
jgi:hypothetical protein